MLRISKIEIKKKIKLYLSIKNFFLNLNIAIKTDKSKNKPDIGNAEDNKNIPIKNEYSPIARILIFF